MFPQTERLALKILQTDKATLRHIAALDGEAMSVVVRRLIRQEAQRRGLWPLRAGVYPDREEGQDENES